MKTGVNVKKNPSAVLSKFDFVWYELLFGDNYIPGYKETWAGGHSLQRGIIHKVYLDTDPRSPSNNASKMVELIGTLGLGTVNNGVPIIVDVFEKPDGEGYAKFEFDHLKTYLSYLKEYLNLSTKPLVRINPTMWNRWHENNPVEAVKLLNVCDLLVANWGLVRPEALDKIGRQKWFEYADGLVKFDETGQWVVEESETPPGGGTDNPPVETGTTVVNVSLPKGYVLDGKLNIFTGRFKGTMTAVEEEE